jgi:uncharacterized membrane protein YeaQ/YmgE (transglycosylase-associated protein family)
LASEVRLFPVEEKEGTVMSLMWMIIAGVTAGAAAKLLLPSQPAGGLFILGIGGAIITGVMQYSMGQAAGFGVPLLGAVVLLIVYAFTTKREIVEKTARDDTRKAA